MANEVDPPNPSIGFPTTRWTDLRNATLEDDEVARKALESFFRKYWAPMVGFATVLFVGQDQEWLEEKVQEFIADKVVEGNFLANADPTRGSFRNLLRTSLRNYVISAIRKTNAHRTTELLESEGAGQKARDVFDLSWAAAVIKNAVDAMEHHYTHLGRRDIFRAFEARVLQPLAHSIDKTPYDKLATELKITPQEARQLLTTAKRKFHLEFNKAIWEYLPSHDEANVEADEILRIILDSPEDCFRIALGVNHEFFV